MRTFVVPFTQGLVPFAAYEKIFTATEIDWFRLKAATSVKTEGSTGGKDAPEPLRRSQLCWLNDDSEHHWVFERLSSLVSNANAKFWNFDLTGFGEELQLARYAEDDKGQYGWHHDIAAGVSRKLSITVQLSLEDDYEGGDLQLFAGAEQMATVSRKVGAVVVFPSFVLHRVMPVTRGVRYSLTAWVSGPSWR